MTGRQALDLLGRGLAHVAGVHLATDEEPDANERTARDAAGAGHRLLRVARWEEGLAVAPVPASGRSAGRCGRGCGG